MKPLALGTLFLLAGFAGILDGREPGDTSIRSGSGSDASSILESVRARHDLPALTAAILMDGEVVASGATGVRTHGGERGVTVEDKFHIGSITKSMTATVAAMLVEKGTVSWGATIADAFPEWEGMADGYREVTLEQLLAHRGGAPEDVPAELWRRAWEASGTPAEQRLAFVEEILARPPEVKPGTATLYSNAGYSIAGVMLERAAEENWEDLVRTRLFNPLDMDSAGFGAPAAGDPDGQPWGHARGRLGEIEPVAPGPGADNPLAISPAGAVHCSAVDLLKYAAFHLNGARDLNETLRPETFHRLHRPMADDDFALGWIAVERDWAGGRALTHTGSNTMFYAVLWIAPERNLALVAMTNIGGPVGFRGCDEAVSRMYREFGAERPEKVLPAEPAPSIR